jgi:glutathione S-transferase
MDWTYTFQKEFQRPIFWPLVRTAPEKRDAGAIEAARKICADLLKIPEQYLARRRYLAGNELTIADIPLGCHVQLWMRLPLTEQPHLRAWFERLCERPAYRKTSTSRFPSLREAGGGPSVRDFSPCRPVPLPA